MTFGLVSPAKDLLDRMNEFMKKYTGGEAGMYAIGDVIGLYARGGRLAALLDGAVEVRGVISGGKGRALRCAGILEVTDDIHLTGGDCAEDFEIAEIETGEPGTVMVLGEEGLLLPSSWAYDKRVAGVVSGAGDYKPGIVLDKQNSRANRRPIALLGKVYCKVDAGYAPIEVGDLLTTAPTLGHAMKATDPRKAFGAVLGKALRPMKEGQGLLPVLIALQ